MFTIAIFTASTQDYCDKIIEKIDPYGTLIKYCFYRRHCIKIDGKLIEV